ncbi:MAG: ATP-binding protein [Algoriphagus sp.]|uniref:ATP-binding protein n=1 Tax=Algoriphagus sp. TaxID=1872435 RepID=UPI00273067C8|nr:ATP-binding protein [Algoriphagus sp.]MDP2040458.1 ATP-binding protein [Algoriphagus sp.]MDP3470335.1 ATP-binding protein [Algoriphagus sp.]
MQVSRTINSQLEDQLFKGKVLILYGARRTGKTTLVKHLLTKFSDKSAYINCELQEYKDALSTTNSGLLAEFIGNRELIIFDEAQHISDIGMVLKVLVDTFPQVQFIATGSSSFELSGMVSEPLTGRSRQFLLLPFSLEEIGQTLNPIQIKASLPNFLRFGLYPQVFNSIGDEKIEELAEISSNYLYKDLFQFEQIKKPDLLFKLLAAIALQTGSESSLNELAQITGTNVHTVKRYLELLEKSFVIFRLNSFSRNLRKELAKSQKIYFYDVGIRNAVIRNFNEMNLRTDAGGLWENFCITERIKFNQNHRRFVNTYFWRTYDQKEIDYIEEKDGHLTCFEFKYAEGSKGKFPSEFSENYPDSSFKVITPANFFELYK